MLAKSGLLEITMKTADLIRSNQQAQRELDQLKVLKMNISTHPHYCFFLCCVLCLYFSFLG